MEFINIIPYKLRKIIIKSMPRGNFFFIYKCFEFNRARNYTINYDNLFFTNIVLAMHSAISQSSRRSTLIDKTMLFVKIGYFEGYRFIGM